MGLFRILGLGLIIAGIGGAATLEMYVGAGGPNTSLATEEGMGPRARFDLTGGLGPLNLSAECMFGGPYDVMTNITDAQNHSTREWEVGAATRGGPVFGGRTMVGWDLRWARTDSTDAFLIAATVGRRYHPGRTGIAWYGGAGSGSIRQGGGRYNNWKHLAFLAGIGVARDLNRSAALGFNLEVLTNAYVFEHAIDPGFTVRFDAGPVFSL